MRVMGSRWFGGFPREVSAMEQKEEKKKERNPDMELLAEVVDKPEDLYIDPKEDGRRGRWLSAKRVLITSGVALAALLAVCTAVGFWADANYYGNAFGDNLGPLTAQRKKEIAVLKGVKDCLKFEADSYGSINGRLGKASNVASTTNFYESLLGDAVKAWNDFPFDEGASLSVVVNGGVYASPVSDMDKCRPTALNKADVTITDVWATAWLELSCLIKTAIQGSGKASYNVVKGEADWTVGQTKTYTKYGGEGDSVGTDWAYAYLAIYNGQEENSWPKAFDAAPILDHGGLDEANASFCSILGLDWIYA